MAGAQLNRERIAERLDDGYLDATTLMEHLIGRGVPQRTAHERGRAAGGEGPASRACRWPELALADFQEADPSLDKSVYDVLGAANAVAAMQSHGSTGPDQVRRQVARWKRRFEE